MIDSLQVVLAALAMASLATSAAAAPPPRGDAAAAPEGAPRSPAPEARTEGSGVSTALAVESGGDVGGLELEPLAPLAPDAVEPGGDQPPAAAPSLPASFWHAPPRRVWVGGGIGVVLLGAAAYVGYLSQATFDEAAGDVTQLRRQALNDRGATQARVANVLLGAGAASLGAALVMAAVDLLQAPESGGEADGE